MIDQPKQTDETTELLSFFDYEHLPTGPLRTTSMRFHDLAVVLVSTLPRTRERTVALRKLLEGKDAAVRCAVAVARTEQDPVVGQKRESVDSSNLVHVKRCSSKYTSGDDHVGILQCQLDDGHASPHRSGAGKYIWVDEDADA